MAPDTSHIFGAHFLDRGYENLVEKLSSLGADVSRHSSTPKKAATAVA
jgi:UDP-N-acetylglucosamine enolpyruvyl transferase